MAVLCGDLFRPDLGQHHQVAVHLQRFQTLIYPLLIGQTDDLQSFFLTGYSLRYRFGIIIVVIVRGSIVPVGFVEHKGRIKVF